jgi:hypothetical protein
MSPEFAIGFIPFILIFVAFIAAFTVLLPTKMSLSDITEIVIGMGTIWLVIIMVLLFMSFVCLNISPMERFTDAVPSEFLESLTATEKVVCSLMGETDKFIQGDVGQAGTDNPALVVKAQADALAQVGAPTTECPLETKTLTVEDRLSRMEMTLAKFVEPAFVKTFKSTQTCEGFETETSKESPNEIRLKNIKVTIHRLTGKYLEPIQKKTSELQQGIMSDCDRKKGAEVAVVKPSPP